MSDGVTEHEKKFVFKSNTHRAGESDTDYLEIIIPEQLQASYSFYTWPSAPVLAWFLWERRRDLIGQRVVEIGAGTALPGIVAAKCGAIVTLTDSATLPGSLRHCRRVCEANGVADKVRVLGLTWGLFLADAFSLGPVDLLLGSDCFYEPAVFEDVVATVAFILEANPHARFLCTYQERSADWSAEHLFRRWRLRCEHIPLTGLGAEAGLDVDELMQDHTIHLLEITRIILKVHSSIMAGRVAARKLFVGNLPWTVGHNELRQYFSEFGHVASANVVFNRETGISRGYGFVIFGNKSALAAVLDRTNHALEGNYISVQAASN